MIDKTVKFLMGYKKYIGEFSMDLYYNDIAKDDEAYVVRVQFFNGQIEHFRSSSFALSLGKAFEYFMSIVENKE